MWVLRFLTAVLGLLGRGGSPAMMLNLTVPRSGYRVRRGLAYGKAPRQRFDLYLPKVLTTPAPIVLFFYGGAFRAGRRSEYRVVGEALTSKASSSRWRIIGSIPKRAFPIFSKTAPMRSLRSTRGPPNSAAIRRAFSSPVIRRAAISR